MLICSHCPLLFYPPCYASLPCFKHPLPAHWLTLLTFALMGNDSIIGLSDPQCNTWKIIWATFFYQPGHLTSHRFYPYRRPSVLVIVRPSVRPSPWSFLRPSVRPRDYSIVRPSVPVIAYFSVDYFLGLSHSMNRPESVKNSMWNEPACHFKRRLRVKIHYQGLPFVKRAPLISKSRCVGLASAKMLRITSERTAFFLFLNLERQTNWN